MLPSIVLGLAAVIGIFAVVVALQPAQFRITRSRTIAAPPSAPFALVNDFHKWPSWSPWEKIDPALKRTYEGPPAGVGSVYSWAGNKQVGEGRMTITESHPSELIRIKLEFLRPFKATNTAEFVFKPQGDQTLVTWNMLGDKNFMFKAIHMFMNMDKMVGNDFEKGLEAMKSVVESETAMQRAKE
jgi:hypothetical protein